MAGALYTLTAVTRGFGFVYFGIRMSRLRTAGAARNVLLASVAYLPLLLSVMVLDSI
jgi:heme O synthase-like polyprenyltransferase